MEKQRIKTIAKSCRRLLIFTLIFFSTFQSFSQTLTASMIRELLITPTEDQNLYAKEDLKFEVYIPYVKSNQVQVQSPSLPANVSFKQIKKTDFSGGGIKLEVWYSFSKKGEYQLPPLPLVIQNRRRTINFAPVTVVDNPADMSPRIVMQFSDGPTVYSDIPADPIIMPLGQKIEITVNLQYAVQLIQFTYDIPKDSIFTQKNLYEINEIKYREKKYSDELIPVASFEWTGLVKGLQIMPSVKLQVTGYNGYRVDVIMPEFTVDFEPPEELELAEEASSFFDEAFDFDMENLQNENKVVITDSICNELAQLRIAERRHFLNHKWYKHRREMAEEKYQMPVSEGEFNIGLYYISIALLVVMIVIFILVLRKKHQNISIMIATLLICSFAFYVYAQVKESELYGIFKGGKVTAIPEKNAESFSEINAGNRVRVTEKAGKWYYIELGETGGWCEFDTVILIR